MRTKRFCSDQEFQQGNFLYLPASVAHRLCEIGGPPGTWHYKCPSMSRLCLSPSLLVVVVVVLSTDPSVLHTLNVADYILENVNPDSDENRSLRKYAHLLRAAPNVTAVFSAIVCVYSHSNTVT